MKKSSTITTILLLLMAMVIFITSVIKEDKNNSKNDEVVNQIQSIISPYQNKDKMKKVDIINNFTNSSFENQPTIKANKNLNASGQIKEGYLYVKASVDNGNPLTQYDGVFVMLQSGNIVLSGHLVKGQSLETPDNKTATEFLYKLSDVKYKKSYNSSDLEIQSGNWLQVINKEGNKKILTFSSTERIGVLENVSIYYNCMDGEECLITSE